MSIQTTTRASTLPRVNLLPPEIGERKRLQQVQAAVVLAIVAVLGGVGYVYVQGEHEVQTAKTNLAAETAKNSQLTAQLATYRNVTALQAQQAAAEAMLTQATSTEVRWSGFLADFGFIQSNTWLTNLTLTNRLPAGSLATPSGAPDTIGRISVNGFALKYGDLATWLDALAGEQDALKHPLFSNVYFSSAAESYIGDTKVVGFQGSADLTSAGLSGRCAQPGSC